MDVSRETEARLQAYQALVEKWNRHINLVSPSTLPDFRNRHVLDCLQISKHLEEVTSWTDIGSGGGLPGIVLAILFAPRDVPFVMIESDQRKAAFLRTAVRELFLINVRVLAERIEEAKPQKSSNVSARALAPLAELLPLVQRHLAPDGTAWLMKGKSWKRECEEAKKNWHFNVTPLTSITDPEAAILKVTGVSHA